MILTIESIVLCLLFTLMVYLISREPIKSLYNYPPKIQERVKTLDEYKNQIPTQKNKLAAKIGRKHSVCGHSQSNSALKKQEKTVFYES